MYNTQEILDAARTIRPELPVLLENEPAVDAAELDALIAALLGRAEQGESVDNSVLSLLAATDPTREWLRSYLDAEEKDERLEAMRSFRRPAGNPDPIVAQRYVCPVDGQTAWYKQFEGEEIPLCVDHNVRLVPEAEA
jgi:hypothetical protein